MCRVRCLARAVVLCRSRPFDGAVPIHPSVMAASPDRIASMLLRVTTASARTLVHGWPSALVLSTQVWPMSRACGLAAVNTPHCPLHLFVGLVCLWEAALVTSLLNEIRQCETRPPIPLPPNPAPLLLHRAQPLLIDSLLSNACADACAEPAPGPEVGP